MEGLALPVLLFGALGLMMFFGMRKQKRQAAEVKQLQEQVVEGARIMTTSGLHGAVTAVADDTIEVEISPGVRTTWARAAVRDIIVPVVSEDDDDDHDAMLDSGTDYDDGESR